MELVTLLACSVTAAVTFLLFATLAVARQRYLLSFGYHTPNLADPLPPAMSVDGVEAFIKQRDQAHAPLKPNNESAIYWAPGKENVQVELCVVMIHGWSSCPIEIDPVDAAVARALGAHLLRYRLTGHGLAPPERAGEMMLKTATRDALFGDVATAFALGKLLGRRVVLLGVSMGGGISTWLATRPWALPELAGLLLIAPAYGVNTSRVLAYKYFKWFLRTVPTWLSRALLHASVGPVHGLGMRKSPEARARQMKAWTMAYPSECLLNTIDIFLTIEFGVNSADLKVPTCVMYNPSDPIVCLESFKKVLQAAPSISYLKVADSEEPHNLTGNLMSPSTVDRCSRHFIDFLHANLK